MKRYLYPILILLALTGCGAKTSYNVTTAKNVAQGWVGNWRGLDSTDKQIFSIDITTTTIQINWDGEDGTKALYWLGSFPVVVDIRVTSIANTEVMSHSILASRNATKEFTYSSGKLTFEASALGVTRTIHLERSQK